MTKAAFDSQLKSDSTENRFTVDGDYIVFDKTSNLSYKILPAFTLGDLLTSNPVSLTRLNKGLLLSLNAIQENLGSPIVIRASYRSPEYDLLNFGLSQSGLYKTGNALSLGVPAELVVLLDVAIVAAGFDGEIGRYAWGVHIGRTKESKEWNTREDVSVKQKFINLLLNDKMKTVLLVGGAAAAVWFFFIKK